MNEKEIQKQITKMLEDKGWNVLSITPDITTDSKIINVKINIEPAKKSSMDIYLSTF